MRHRCRPHLRLLTNARSNNIVNAVFFEGVWLEWVLIPLDLLLPVLLDLELGLPVYCQNLTPDVVTEPFCFSYPGEVEVLKELAQVATVTGGDVGDVAMVVVVT